VANARAVGDVVVLRAPDVQREPTKVDQDQLHAVETEGWNAVTRTAMSPEMLQQLLLAAAKNGQLGERHVLEEERRRLKASGHPDLADLVSWTSQKDVGAGFDIHSFNADGSDRLIEVKSTSGTSKRFYISKNEWKIAQRKGDKYWIYRVTKVGSRRPTVVMFNNPIELLKVGKLKREPNEWIMWPA
jgi:hypothetical protein